MHADGSLPGKAVEKWRLFRLLPLLVGHLVPVDNIYWELYLICREIGDIILAPRVQRSMLGYLKLRISDFLELFHELYPGKMTPKCH